MPPADDFGTYSLHQQRILSATICPVDLQAHKPILHLLAKSCCTMPCFAMSYAVAVGIANLWHSCMNVNARIKQQQQKNNWVRCFNWCPQKLRSLFIFTKEIHSFQPMLLKASRNFHAKALMLFNDEKCLKALF